jgi:hypothetical protein
VIVQLVIGWFFSMVELAVRILIRLSGGESHRGRLMLSFILFQIMIENHLKKVRFTLPRSCRSGPPHTNLPAD